jgi:hypothetical protein
LPLRPLAEAAFLIRPFPVGFRGKQSGGSLKSRIGDEIPIR